MKRSVIIILAVAIIGALGVAAKSPKPDDGAARNARASSPSSGPSVQSANTSMGLSPAATSYKDGTYDGDSEDTPYGPVQVAVVVSGGKITDVKFLRMPDERGHTQEVTAFAEPYLKDETLQNQSAHIQFVSGASTTSDAYQQSLQAALDQAT